MFVENVFYYFYILYCDELFEQILRSHCALSGGVRCPKLVSNYCELFIYNSISLKVRLSIKYSVYCSVC